VKSKFILLLRVIAAVILLQTLFFKFTGSSESVYIFSTLGMEPWGRWFSGFAEMIASFLLLFPATQLIGAAVGLGIMGGAIASHILILGFIVQNDGGLLFSLACTVFICCAIVFIANRGQIPVWLQRGKNILNFKKA
jgi:putative oxidoreductase